jgi:protein-tyrosine phosphatase
MQGNRQATDLVTEILVLCTANQCRSVMAELLLRHRLAAVGGCALVRSAGTFGADGPPPPEVISALAAYGLDAAAHRGRALSEGDLAGSDLVLASSREHLRHAVVVLPGAWPRAFTLKELVRRGQQIGPRLAGEPLAGWLRRVHDGRDRSALLGDSEDDDLADPTGGTARDYIATAAQLDDLLARLVRLAWGWAS